jgi:hypothetical protein
MAAIARDGRPPAPLMPAVTRDGRWAVRR